MDSTIETVRGYYDEHAQLEWDRLKERPFEFIFTTEMMERYVRPGDRILDIGGGPGRYSIHFAQMGCQVVLAELSSGNVALAREKAAEDIGKFLKLLAANNLLDDGVAHGSVLVRMPEGKQ